MGKQTTGMSVEEMRSEMTAAGQFRTERVRIRPKPTGREFDIEVRELSVRDRGRIRQRALKDIGKRDEVRVDYDYALSEILTVIAVTFRPGSDEVVFDDSFVETLQGLPAGGWFSAVLASSNRLNNADHEALAKNSEATPSDN